MESIQFAQSLETAAGIFIIILKLSINGEMKNVRFVEPLKNYGKEKMN